MSTEFEGGCLCGAIRYRVSDVPTNSMVCHCRSCRRVAGAPVVAWVTFAADQFELLRGSPAEIRSSEPVRRRFGSERYAADLRASRWSRVRRRDDVQPGRPRSVSTDASLVAQPQRRVGALR